MKKQKKNAKTTAATTTTTTIIVAQTTKTQRVFDKKNIFVIAIAIFQKQKTMRKARLLINNEYVRKRFAKSQTTIYY